MVSVDPSIDRDLSGASGARRGPSLTAVLTDHVVPGRVFEAEVPVGAPIGTVRTGTFSTSAGLAITDARSRTANIVATDTLTSNGVIHVIDKVLLPAP